MNIAHPIRRAIPGALALLAAAAIAAAPAARADEVLASDAPIAAAATTSVTAVPTAVANRPRTIVVTNHDGASVTLFAKGENIRRNLAPGSRPAVFTGLTAGRVYTVAVGGEPIGTVVALDRPAAAHSLVVRRAAGEGAVALSWRQSATAATGGARVSFTVTASSPSAPTITRTVVGSRATTLTGLDQTALYSFTVTPRNSAGVGRSTRASMSAPLGRTITPAVANTPAGTPVAVTPPTTTPSAPAAPPAPSTRTIYRCPDGFTETSAGLCRKATPYSFTSIAYTYTWGVVGSHSVPDDYAANVGPLAQGPVCPWGGYYVEPGICRGATSHSVTDYGNVKDPTPAGYTDDGTQWVKRDPIPDGYTDDGSQWVAIVAKEAVTVPA